MNAPYEALFGALHGLAPNMPDPVPAVRIEESAPPPP